MTPLGRGEPAAQIRRRAAGRSRLPRERRRAHRGRRHRHRHRRDRRDRRPRASHGPRNHRFSDEPLICGRASPKPHDRGKHPRPAPRAPPPRHELEGPRAPAAEARGRPRPLGGPERARRVVIVKTTGPARSFARPASAALGVEGAPDRLRVFASCACVLGQWPREQDDASVDGLGARVAGQNERIPPSRVLQSGAIESNHGLQRAAHAGALDSHRRPGHREHFTARRAPPTPSGAARSR